MSMEATASSDPSSPHVSWSDLFSKAKNAIEGLSSILPFIPPSLSSSETPALDLLHDHEIAAQISTLLRQPDSGAGDNNLCRWLYDTFQSSEPDLQLVVLRFLPIISGVYLSRIALRKPLAGFEAVLLALYAHETTSRNGQAVTVSIPDLSHSSIYHETKQISKNNATELNLAVVSPSLEPHGTVRSTRRARIVGVALELYYNKISRMPVSSKIDFCEFCDTWAGQSGDMYKDGPDNEMGMFEERQIDDLNAEKETRTKEGRIHLPWELLQPTLRILGHCLMGPKGDKDLHEAAFAGCMSLYSRSVHDINPKAIMATASLLRLSKMASDPAKNVDYTEVVESNVITL